MSPTLRLFVPLTLVRVSGFSQPRGFALPIAVPRFFRTGPLSAADARFTADRTGEMATRKKDEASHVCLLY